MQIWPGLGEASRLSPLAVPDSANADRSGERLGLVQSSSKAVAPLSQRHSGPQARLADGRSGPPLRVLLPLLVLLCCYLQWQGGHAELVPGLRPSQQPVQQVVLSVPFTDGESEAPGLVSEGWSRASPCGIVCVGPHWGDLGVPESSSGLQAVPVPRHQRGISLPSGAACWASCLPTPKACPHQPAHRGEGASRSRCTKEQAPSRVLVPLPGWGLGAGDASFVHLFPWHRLMYQSLFLALGILSLLGAHATLPNSGHLHPGFYRVFSSLCACPVGAGGEEGQKRAVPPLDWGEPARLCWAAWIFASLSC